MSNQVVIYLNRAASGIIPGMLVVKLMALELPNLLSLLLPIGFYFSLLLAYGRLYADSEMTVMRACGFSVSKLLFYSLVMAGFVAVVTAVMIAGNPSIAYKRAKLLQTTGIKTLIQTIVPGRFRAINNGRDVFYVEHMNHQHTKAKNIFLARAIDVEGKKQWDVLWANRALIKSSNKKDIDYLLLEDGRNYQGIPGQVNFQVAKFTEYKSKLPNPNVIVKNDIRTVPFASLWPFNNSDLKKAAELQWRISIPLMVIPLTLVGVPLSRVSPRGGKYAKLLPAIVLCVAYANFMFIARDWIIAGKIPVWIGMWWLHLLVALFGLWLFWRNRGA